MINSRRRFLRIAAMAPPSAIIAGSGSGMLSGVLADAHPNSQLIHRHGNNACHPLLSHEFRRLMGPERNPLCDQFTDKVLLIVNTASRCGFTPQFAGLEKLYEKYSYSGFSVLGFPSADFRQELASEEAVAQFCEINYGVTFPMFEKVHVTGKQAHPFFQQLAEATGSLPRWNFNKYLINRHGEPVAHFDSSVLPMGTELTTEIESLL